MNKISADDFFRQVSEKEERFRSLPVFIQKISKAIDHLRYMTTSAFWENAYRYLRRVLIKKENRAHMYTDLPSGSWNCFETVVERAIPLWFLKDWPNYIQHSAAVQRGFEKAREWYLNERAGLVAQLEKMENSFYEDLYRAPISRKEKDSRFDKMRALRTKIHDTDTKHLCFIITHRDDVTD